MLRRDVFNLLFNKRQPAEIAQLPDPVLVTPGYLAVDQMAVYHQEWESLSIPSILMPGMLTQYAFTIIMGLQQMTACLEIGIKDDQAAFKPIHLGLDHGRLFIGAIKDDRVLNNDKLEDGITLILTVNPQPNGGSYAKLKALDKNGLTLSVIKSTTCRTADWAGSLKPSPNFNTFCLHGHQHQN